MAPSTISWSWATINEVTDGATISGTGGLIYTAADRTITGTPTTAAMGLNLSWLAGDSDSNTDLITDVAYNPFTITITGNADTAPAFDSAVPDTTDLVFRVGQVVAHNLPQATGGNGALTYTLNGMPPGLTFDGAAARRPSPARRTEIATAGSIPTQCGTPDDDTDSRSSESRWPRRTPSRPSAARPTTPAPTLRA